MPGRTACLAHIGARERESFLASLVPGADIDHRGTPVTKILLDALLQALRHPATGPVRIGCAQFDGARFTGKADFGGARFGGEASFDGATFTGETRFTGAKFTGAARFRGTMFNGDARFNGDSRFSGARFADIAFFQEARFGGEAQFNDVAFTGTAGFGEATFAGKVGFMRARFNGDAWFGSATFNGGAAFSATFNGDARFPSVTFNGDAWFGGATFAHKAVFDKVTFNGDARFGRATFHSDARFGRATFHSDAQFGDAKCNGDAEFGEATFAVLSDLGPLLCTGRVDLEGAVFKVPVTVEIAAPQVNCRRTWWMSTAALRLRYATVDLADAVLSSPVAVSAHPTAFTNPGGLAIHEDLLAGADRGVRVTSVRGVDAAHLVLTDTDLSACRFSGAFHLDQLRLEGDCTFAPVPTGHHIRPPFRWTRRRTLAEEHHWRADQTASDPGPPRGWSPGSPSDHVPQPAGVAATYRQLRKALEDSKNEPGAADFYYGEMEMRRRDRTGTTTVERGLIRAYWLLSGYGLRASRALYWLGLTMSGTVLTLMLWGLPTTVPLPSATGTITGDTISLNTNRPDLSLAGDRWTLQRADRAVRVSVNAVVFRTSGQNLTHAGIYIEMLSRIIEPILLALAVLAVRERVKR
ncbi:pentapeptide repeat-containing protein [Streptomyces sp. NPDC051364]|uniref:pentapeptide repeat-containing protein n=1 Tax=Streptomyces sp. NPDC051364 TaxID=3155799 RepID=UPI00344600AA